MLKNKKKTAIAILGVLLITGGISSASAQTNTAQKNIQQGGQRGGQGQDGQGSGIGQMKQGQGLMGEITGISGNSITIKTSMPNDLDGKVYTVDASNAVINKLVFPEVTTADTTGSTAVSVMATPVIQTISDLAVGEKIQVRGEINDATNVIVAKEITEVSGNIPQKQNGLNGFGQQATGGGIVGTVQSITGTTIVVKDMKGTVYTIDASAAEIKEGVTASTISDIAVGSRIAVSGTISSINITAKTVLTNLPESPVSQNASIQGQVQSQSGQKEGFFRKILNFFGFGRKVQVQQSQ